jgi:heme-degrading monooxygenase HmoA
MSFIAMNRFRIALGREEEFEQIWRERESNLPGVPGFEAFHLLRGPSNDEFTLFASHTVWASRQHFEDWTKSDAFRRSHNSAARSGGLYLGPPQLELFDIVQELIGLAP